MDGIRAKLLTVPGIVGIDISTIAGTGAVIKIAYANSFQALQDSLRGSGLKLVQMGRTWVLQPL